MVNISANQAARLIEERLGDGKTHLVTDRHLQAILLGYRTNQGKIAFLEGQLKEAHEKILRLRMNTRHLDQRAS